MLPYLLELFLSGFSEFLSGILLIVAWLVGCVILFYKVKVFQFFFRKNIFPLEYAKKSMGCSTFSLSDLLGQ